MANNNDSSVLPTLWAPRSSDPFAPSSLASDGRLWYAKTFRRLRPHRRFTTNFGPQPTLVRGRARRLHRGRRPHRRDFGLGFAAKVGKSFCLFYQRKGGRGFWIAGHANPDLPRARGPLKRIRNMHSERVCCPVPTVRKRNISFRIMQGRKSSGGPRSNVCPRSCDAALRIVVVF